MLSEEDDTDDMWIKLKTNIVTAFCSLLFYKLIAVNTREMDEYNFFLNIKLLIVEKGRAQKLIWNNKARLASSKQSCKVFVYDVHKDM